MWYFLLIGSVCAAGASVSCTAPTSTSLMQLDVQGSSRVALAAERSSRSQTLGEFQKYAENLAGRFMGDPNHPNDPSPGHDTGLNDTEEDAVDLIIHFVDDMFSHLDMEHHTELELVQRDCHDAFDECKKKKDDITVNVSNATAIGKLHIHNACRRQARYEANCEDYDDHRKDEHNKFPICALDGDLSDEMIKVDEIHEPHKLDMMESCLVEVYEWMQKIYPLYLHCLEEREDNNHHYDDCVEKQDAFEKACCSYALSHYHKCDAYIACHERVKGDCEYLCDMIAESVAARKADNETAERVQCLLYVLKADNPDKHDDLQKCKEKHYDTSYWDIDCGHDFHVMPQPVPPCHPALRRPCGGFPLDFPGGAPDANPTYPISPYEYFKEDWHSDWLDEGIDVKCRPVNDCQM